jgi:hypothetical protein
VNCPAGLAIRNALQEVFYRAVAMVLSFRQKPFLNFTVLGMPLMRELTSYFSNFNYFLARIPCTLGGSVGLIEKMLGR